MKHLLILIMLISLMPFVLWAAPFDDFMDKVMQSSQSDEELNRLVQQYLYKAQSLEEHRTLQNVWSRLDKEACQAHYIRLAKQYPNDPEYAYLKIRLLDGEESIAGAHALLAKHPKFYWGYRVIAVNTAARLNSEEAADYLKSLDFTKDAQALAQGRIEFPEDDYIKLALAYRYHAEENPEQALKYVSALSDPTVVQNNFDMIQEVCQQNKRRDVYEKTLNIMMPDAVKAGSVTQEEADFYTSMYILDFIAPIEGIAGIDQYIAQHPELKESGESITHIAGLYLDNKEPQKAIDYLELALSKGAVNYPELENSSQYAELSENPRWKNIIDAAKIAWEQDSSARTKTLLEGRLSKPAANWELNDLDGKTHKLEDMRDYIVILDFWAVWCNPCKMVMPSLSKWVMDAMPRGVKVYSVNVMENDYDKAKAYFKENKYAMTYLEGNADVASAYGVRGIPHIVVIDKRGTIAWEQVGFSYDLEEKLSIWVEHLGRE